MIVEQIYTGCLAQGAYYIESNGEAAVIDPLRDTSAYLNRAEKSGATIKYIFETHFHADFVSGHLDLARETGASIVFGPKAVTDFEATIAKDGDVFKVGDLTIKVLHTPGHTMESSTFLLLDPQNKPTAIFTGDTLFIGDVGRPDLAIKSDLTKEDLAGYLYDSLHTKILPLPDDVIVYPAHGAGSACGKNMSKETSDTLGNQKETNYALKATSKEQFVKEVTDGLLPPPYYFPKNAMMNKMGYTSFQEVKNQGLTALTPEQFELLAEAEEALVLDTRKPADFAKSHIPRSINIGIDGDFAPWVGTLITDIKQPILLVTDYGREEESLTRLARVGYENILGFLKGGLNAWAEAGKESDSVKTIDAAEFQIVYNTLKPKVVDVRKQSEFEAQHVEGALLAPLSYLNDHLEIFANASDQEAIYVHCAGGYRSMIACSILKARGYQNLVNVNGGFKAIEQTAIPTTEYVCQASKSKL